MLAASAGRMNGAGPAAACPGRLAGKGSTVRQSRPSYGVNYFGLYAMIGAEAAASSLLARSRPSVASLICANVIFTTDSKVRALDILIIRFSCFLICFELPISIRLLVVVFSGNNAVNKVVREIMPD